MDMGGLPGSWAEERLRETGARPLSFPRGEQLAVVGAPGLHPQGWAFPSNWEA